MTIPAPSYSNRTYTEVLSTVYYLRPSAIHKRIRSTNLVVYGPTNRDKIKLVDASDLSHNR